MPPRSNAAATKEPQSTALAVIDRNSFLALADAGQDVREAMLSVAQTGESFGPNDLTRVKMPTGGGTMWEIPDGLGGEEYTPVIRGALVFTQQHGVLWPSFDPKPGAVPVLRSYDMQVAEITGPIPEEMLKEIEAARIDEKHVDLSKLSYNTFGTGKDGNGKRFREQRLLFVLRENDIYPLCLTVQPGSLNVWRKFIMNLPKAGVPYHRAVIELSLEKDINGAGQPYSKIIPRLAGTLSKEDGEMIRKTYQSVLEKGVAKEVAQRDTEDNTGE